MNERRNEEIGVGEEAEELEAALIGLPSAPSPVEPASVGSPVLPDMSHGPVEDVAVDASSSHGEPTPVGEDAGLGQGEETDRSQERMAAACAAVVGLFERLGADVAVEPEDTDAAIVCHVKIKRGAGVLEVGPRGQVLESIQYLANRMAGRDAERGKRITVEVGGFRDEATEPAMIEMAHRLGETARRMGKTLTIVPIQARDRRVIHTSLAAMDGIRTRSEGEGNLRRLLIELADDSTEVNDGNP